MLIHIVDVSGSEGRDPKEDFRIINEELRKFNPELAQRPMVVAGNKCDLTSDEQVEDFRKFVEAQEMCIRDRMSDALEAGASDFQADEDVFEISTEPSDFSGVRDDLEAKGYTFVSAEVEMVPDTYTTLSDPDQILKMQKLIDALEDNDDVQQVWHNWDAPEEEDED